MAKKCLFKQASTAVKTRNHLIGQAHFEIQNADMDCQIVKGDLEPAGTDPFPLILRLRDVSTFNGVELTYEMAEQLLKELQRLLRIPK